MDNKKMIGVTIGPIVETISEAKKVKEIAHASRYFSYVIQRFLVKVSQNSNYKIVTPHSKRGYENEDNFPDRGIIIVEKNMEISEIDRELKEIYNSTFSPEEKILREYLNFNYLIDTDYTKSQKDRVQNIFLMLDGLELIKVFPSEYSEGDILKEIEKALPEKFKGRIKDEEKYYAIIALDIDNLGQTVQKSSDDISQKISHYISELNKIVKDLEGITIFSAGDDLLARISPNKIMEFVKKSNEAFKGIFTFESSTVSYGVSICYKKYPIKEAIEEAFSQLFSQAKKEKDTLSILIKKHSGQSIQLNINKLKNPENIFRDKFSMLISEDKDNKLKLMNTIIQKLSSYEFIFQELFKKKESPLPFIGNIFEEEINKKENKFVFEQLNNLIMNVETQENFRELISLFKAVKFYNFDQTGGER